MYVPLVCPRDRSPLSHLGGLMRCSSGHEYRVVSGIPILLVPEDEPTHHACVQSLTARDQEGWSVDSVISTVISATSGYLYSTLAGKPLPRYPIPEIRLLPSQGQLLLDIGCSWGRWTIAAARKGYHAVGIDPDLGTVLAGRSLADKLGVTAQFVVGDARRLPFPGDTFDVVFSYSVLQHFSKEVVRTALQETARVMKPGAFCLIQMPNKFGMRSLYHQLRGRLGRRGTVGPFRVRYWRPGELRRVFCEVFGSAELSIDGFFGLGIQASDRDLMPARYRMVVAASEFLRKYFPGLLPVADSLYVTSHLR